MSESSEKPKRGEGLLENPNAVNMGAIALIVLGVIFLANELGLRFLTGNWWAIFLALPGLALAYDAYQLYQRNGNVWDKPAREKATGAMFLLLLAFMGFFNAWHLWPLFLIGAGIAAYMRAR